MNKEEAKNGHITLHLYIISVTSDYILVDISHNNRYIIKEGCTNHRDMLINLLRSHAYSCGLMVMTRDWLTMSHKLTL